MLTVTAVGQQQEVDGGQVLIKSLDFERQSVEIQFPPQSQIWRAVGVGGIFHSNEGEIDGNTWIHAIGDHQMQLAFREAVWVYERDKPSYPEEGDKR